MYSSSSRHSGSYSHCVHLAIPNPRHSSSDCQPGPAAHHRRMDTEAAVPAPVPALLEEPPRQEEMKNEEEEEVKQDLGEKEDFEEMFTSALDSPSDSGLAGLDMETPNSSNDDDVMETPNNSDTLEDLSLQVSRKSFFLVHTWLLCSSYTAFFFAFLGRRCRSPRPWRLSCAGRDGGNRSQRRVHTER